MRKTHFNKGNSKEDRTFIDEEFRDPAYWKNPDNAHLGFQRFEELMTELKNDFDKSAMATSAKIIAACNNPFLDKKSKDIK